MKARLVSVQIQFEIMADDGETLTHVNVNPIIVPAGQVDAIPDGVRDVVAQAQAQLDARDTQIKQHPQYAGDVPLCATAPGDESGAE